MLQEGTLLYGNEFFTGFSGTDGLTAFDKNL